MKSFFIRLGINAAALWVATIVVDGVVLEGGSNGDRIKTLLLVALVFGLVNAVIKPVVKLLALPLIVLTLGLITFVINAAMLGLTSALAGALNLQFAVHGFGAALLGALVVSIVSWGLALVLPD